MKRQKSADRGKRERLRGEKWGFNMESEDAELPTASAQVLK